MRLRIADLLESFVGRCGIQPAEVVDGDRQLAVADPLRAVGKDLLTQHRMARSEFRGGRRQAFGIDSGTVEFDVEMRGHPAELLLAVAAHPHRVLDRSEREGLVGIGIRGGRGRDVLGRHLFPVGVVLAHQVHPRADGGTGGEGGESDVDALFAPPAGQRHHSDRVEAGGNQIGVGIQRVW